jgi:hypothetical protein
VPGKESGPDAYGPAATNQFVGCLSGAFLAVNLPSSASATLGAIPTFGRAGRVRARPGEPNGIGCLPLAAARSQPGFDLAG